MIFKTCNTKIILFFFIFFRTAFFLSGEEAVSAKVKKIAIAAFGKNSKEEVVSFMEKEIKKLTSDTDKAAALKILADYEERSELFEAAAMHYMQAAGLCTASLKKKLFIQALASYLLADLTDKALELCHSKLLPLIKSPPEGSDIKTLVYYEWLKLKTSGFENEGERTVVINTLKKYMTDAVFAEFHPAILLTLWWTENDKRAENTLLKNFPGSIEAGVVRGEITLSPQTFWYLMPRSVAAAEEADGYKTEAKKEETPVSGFAGAGAKEGGKTLKQLKDSSAEFFQTGFFKTEDYANAMIAELSKKGFTVFIKEEKRTSGLFYSVLVKADGKGDIVLRLKNEGYEAVPVFE